MKLGGLLSLVWCSMSVILKFERLKQKNYEFEANLGYTVTPCLKNQTRETREKEKERKGGREGGRKGKGRMKIKRQKPIYMLPFLFYHTEDINYNFSCLLFALLSLFL